MLRILGTPKHACDGVTRRDFLLAGGFGALSQALPGGAASASTDRSFGRAKNVILLYPFGGPSQLETFDPKPDAPAEVRGELKAIPTRVPGYRVSEGLPRVARIMDRCTVLRSLTHTENFHGMQYATTGLPKGSIPIEETQRHPEHWPFVGSVATYFNQRREGAKPPGAIPDNLILPFPLSTQRPAALYARPHAAYLGGAFDPLWANFRGKATRSVTRFTNGPDELVSDPYLGITPGSRFELAPEADLSADVTIDRLNKRRSLLQQLDGARLSLEETSGTPSFERNRQRAFSLVDSPRVRNALDLDREPMKLRESYGMTLFGQGALQARRLVEAGCRFVSVVWDEYGQLNSAWDTHVDHFSRMKTDLLPGFDNAFASLIEDLEARGMLDDTLVLVLNEMGRTPKLENARGGGRGHWGLAYCNLMAGAGVARGRVVGKTDSIAGSVVERPLRAKDVLATAYHLLGIGSEATIPDRLNRPVPLLPYGDVIREALA